MKNYLFSEMSGATTSSVSPTEAATLEFCFDHLTEDFSETPQNPALLSQQGDLQPRGIQETE